MKKFIFILLLPAVCSAQIPGQPFGMPPFSDIYKKPIISPYVFLDPNFDLRYYGSVKPLIEQQNQQKEIQTQNKKIYRLQNQIRPTGQNSQNYQNLNRIRPTGHSTYFMYIN
jgi:hypothetical protein